MHQKFFGRTARWTPLVTTALATSWYFQAGGQSSRCLVPSCKSLNTVLPSHYPKQQGFVTANHHALATKALAEADDYKISLTGAVSVSEAISAIKQLVEAGLDEVEAKASVRWLLHELGKQKTETSNPVAMLDTFLNWVQRRASREPVQYIVGRWPFYPLKELVIRPPVLIPRPETEELVDTICRAYQEASTAPQNLLDIGSGTGAIGIALLHSFQKANGVAIDASPIAAALTTENAERCNVANRLKVLNTRASDLAKTFLDDCRFDLIVSNPPYIPSFEMNELQPEVRDFEDSNALDGGVDGLDIVVEVIQCAKLVASKNAHLFLEVHHTHPAMFEQAAALKAASQTTIDVAAPSALRLRDVMDDVTLVRTVRDMFGQPRFIELRIDRP